MKRLRPFVIVGLMMGGYLLQTLPSAASKLDQHASLLADENTAVSFAGKPSCHIERPLVTYTDSETKVVRRIPAIVPPPHCLSAEERRHHEQVNAGLKPLHALYGKKVQEVQDQSKARTVAVKADPSNEATSVMYPTGMLLPKFSPEAFAAQPANAQIALAIAGENFMSLLPQSPATPHAHTQIGQVVRTSNGGAATTLPPEVQAAYDAVNQLTQFNSGTPNVTHDANGNLTSITDATGTMTFTYDARNRLIARNGPGITESYAYDALGRRVSKTTNGATRNYLYDGNDIVAEVQSGAVNATYLRDLNIDKPFVRQSASGNEYYHLDAQGSTLSLTDISGIIRTQYDYDAYGNTTATGVLSSNPFQYTGRENDGLGLYFNRQRYYSPIAHRFLSEDPIGLLGGENVYRYVLNNPLSFTDPFGLDVTVTLYPGASGARHIGVGVNTTQTVGLYPAATANNVAMAMGLNVQGIVQPDSRQPIQTITIPTSAQQDVIVQNLLNQSLASPQTYNLYVRNCAVFVESVLFAAGLQVPITNQPRFLMNGLRQLYPQPGNR